MLIGQANTGKTLMLKLLQQIFGKKLFQNPANSKSGLLGVQDAQVILYNDYRWCEDNIPWTDFLNLLEGETEVSDP